MPGLATDERDSAGAADRVGQGNLELSDTVIAFEEVHDGRPRPDERISLEAAYHRVLAEPVDPSTIDRLRDVALDASPRRV